MNRSRYIWFVAIVIFCFACTSPDGSGGSADAGIDTAAADGGADGSGDPDAGADACLGPSCFAQCGDGVCDNAESCGSCHYDCGVCEPAYYIAPGGSDTAAGTREAPWGTFDHALAQLEPGDTLVALSGVYEYHTTGLLEARCGGTDGFAAGLPDARIWVVSEQRQGALLKVRGDTGLRSSRCDYWTFDGFAISARSDRDISDTTFGAALYHSNHTELRRAVIAAPEGESMDWGLAIGGHDVTSTVEDVEVYDYTEFGIRIANIRANLRRAYFNGRDAAQGPSSVYAVLVSSVLQTAIENVVAEGEQHAIRVYGSHPRVERSSAPNVVIRGGVALRTHTGLLIQPESGHPYTEYRHPGIVSVRDYLIQEPTEGGIGAWGTAAYEGNGGSQLERVTIVAPPDDVSAIEASHTYSYCQPEDIAEWAACEFHVQDSIFYRIGQEVVADDVEGAPVTYTVENSLLWDVAQWPDEPIDDAEGLYRHNLTGAPSGYVEQTGTWLFVPPTSSLYDLASDGGPLGANVLYRYENGVETDQPLWRADASFPCQAVVEGLNDRAGDSCSGVHARLGLDPEELPWAR